MNIERCYNYLYLGMFQKFVFISLQTVIQTLQIYHSRPHPEEHDRNDKWKQLKPLVLPLLLFFILVS